MMRFTLLFVAALLGAAVSVPAQFQERGRHASNHRDRARAAVPVRTVQRRAAPVSRVARHAGRVTGRRVVGGGHESHGHWVTRCERVLVPGYWDTRHLPAVYGWVYDACGHRHWGVIRPARCERFWVPARYEMQERRVWVRC